MKTTMAQSQKKLDERRLNLILKAQATIDLAELEGLTNLSITEIVTKALRLFTAVVKRENAGFHLAIVDKENKVVYAFNRY